MPLSAEQQVAVRARFAAAAPPVRRDLRRCVPCQKKMLRAMRGNAAVNATIYIALSATPGTSTTGISLAEKLRILRRCYESCATEGLPIVLVAAGNRDGIEEVRKAIPGVPLHGVWGASFDRQRGECALGLRILEEAEREKVGWIIKVAGDTFHPAPGWAEKLIEAAEAANADLVATMHHRPGWITTQCYAVRPAFMRATFPPMTADYGRIGIEAQWGERIIAECRAQNAEGRTKWLQPPAKLLHIDGCDNWVPADPAISYLHAHCLASTGGWKPVDTSIQPDLKVRLSIVVPARNEVQLNPHRGNVPLLSDTFESIAATSPKENLPECILVDDASDAKLPIAECRLPNANLRIIRNPTPLGVDPSRNIGIAAATGDVIGILDGHMRVETQQGAACEFGLQKLAALALEKQAIVVARCAHLEMPKHNGEPPMCGGRLMPLTDERHQLAMEWASFTPPTGVRRINGLLGASYFAPREIWRRLQGFVDSCRPWGYSEEGLALKAAFCGVPILYCGDVTISHWFRSNGPHVWPVDDWHKWINRARVLKATFDPDTFDKFWLPRCKRSLWDARYDELLQEHGLLAEAARFRVVKVRSDAEVLREVFHVTL